MRIYFSGWGAEARPSGMNRRPCFMLTYFDFFKKVKKSTELLEAYLDRHKAGEPRAEDCFIDSGAWSLYRLHVLKTGKKAIRMGAHGRVLEEPIIVSGGQAARDFYSLKKGSAFRTYCDAYAKFMKMESLIGKVKYFATVDAIGSAEISKLNQEYFEKEHGLRPVPVVHFGSHPKWLDYYLEQGHKMIGLGGMARRPNKKKIINWCDEAFLRICPASKNYIPQVKIHGFAMTTWQLMRRWPWFSVDSTSYLLYGTYGLICVPFWNKQDRCFRFDRPPMVVSVSSRGRPIDFKTRMHISQGHGDTIEVRKTTHRWLELIGCKMGKADKEHNELEPGVQTNNEHRTAANLRYFMELENHLPPWPWPLRHDIVKHSSLDCRRGGMGLLS